MRAKREPIEASPEQAPATGSGAKKSRPRAATDRTRVDEAYVRILALITEGRLVGGERLPSEGELSASIGVSRPVIRQALSRLQYAGIVKVRWGAGTFVQDAARAASGGPSFGPIQSWMRSDMFMSSAPRWRAMPRRSPPSNVSPIPWRRPIVRWRSSRSH